MPRTFIDSSHLIAVFNPHDEWHDSAIEAAERLDAHGDPRFVTTLLVLEEFLTDLAKNDATLKTQAAEYVDRVLGDPSIEVVEVSFELFRSGLDLYRHRLDKSYSMVDCISMVVCRERGITDVLTADRDFEQERFVALLRQ